MIRRLLSKLTGPRPAAPPRTTAVELYHEYPDGSADVSHWVVPANLVRRVEYHLDHLLGSPTSRSAYGPGTAEDIRASTAHIQPGERRAEP